MGNALLGNFLWLEAPERFFLKKDLSRSPGIKPEIAFNTVVFPAPLAPIRATISPAPTDNETPCRAWDLP